MMRQRLRQAMVFAAVGLAGPAAAHPHIFVETGIEVIFDDEGRATALRIAWTYDELYSLLIVEDRGMDTDYDARLTEAETAALSGFDMDWVPGFAGDTYALLGDRPLVLGPPEDWTVAYAGGMLTSTHLRRLADPVRPADPPLVVQSYDPGFYTGYTVAPAAVLVGGDGCTAQVLTPDPSAAAEELRAALAEYGAEVDLEMDFPAIGAAYADEVRVVCTAAP